MEGEIGRKYGIDWFSNDLLPRNKAEIDTVGVQSTVSARAATAELKLAFARVRIGDVVVAGQGQDVSEHQITAANAANGGAHATVTVSPAVSGRGSPQVTRWW